MDNNENVFDKLTSERDSLFANANERVAEVEEMARKAEESRKEQEEEKARVRKGNAVLLGNEIGSLIISLLEYINSTGLKSYIFDAEYKNLYLLRDYKVEYELGDDALNITLEYDFRTQNGFPRKGLADHIFDENYLKEYLGKYDIEVTCTGREWTSTIGRIDVKCKSKAKEKTGSL